MDDEIFRLWGNAPAFQQEKECGDSGGKEWNSRLIDREENTGGSGGVEKVLKLGSCFSLLLLLHYQGLVFLLLENEWRENS